MFKKYSPGWVDGWVDMWMDARSQKLLVKYSWDLNSWLSKSRACVFYSDFLVIQVNDWLTNIFVHYWNCRIVNLSCKTVSNTRRNLKCEDLVIHLELPCETWFLVNGTIQILDHWQSGIWMVPSTKGPVFRPLQQIFFVSYAQKLKVLCCQTNWI